MAVNLTTNRLLLLTAYQDVIDEASNTDWALYTYEGDSNDLTLASSGGGGLSEITLTFDSGRVMYGFCSLKEPKAALPRYILINWVGDDVPDARKCACASHVATIADFFQGVEVIVNASSLEDVEASAIGQRLTNGTATAAVAASPVLSRLRTREEELADVGTMYEKTNAESEMKKINREEFWQQAKREEELRKEEDRKKVAEERQRFEEERMELEREEQEKRELRYRERERQIEETRKKMQDDEEEKEKLRSQISMPAVTSVEDLSLEKKESEVEEAKAIIAQRSGNPREFFKLKERAMTFSGGTSPVSVHRTGRLDSPFLRQQHKTGLGSPVHSQSHAGTPPPTAAGDDDEERTLSVNSVQKIVTTTTKKEVVPDENSFPLKAEQEASVPEATPPKAEERRDSSSFSVWDSGTDRLVNLWDSSAADSAPPAANSAHSTELVDLMGDDVTMAAVRPQPLLSFDEMIDGTFCSGTAGDDQMTLSYRQALQHASGDHGQLLLTNGDALLKDATQASEGYFSQSQEEDLDSSAKTAPVFYNKPPEIDITCWDTDPVVDDDDD